jgi:prepilin-type processing-associated H-X9-DG protein
MRRFAQTKSKTGFTLGEILVMLAILGILAALSFAAFSRVRENARNTTCQSNLKQIYVANQQYMQDSDSTYSSSFSWREALGPYVSKTTAGADIFVCPSTPPGSMSPPNYINNREYTCYIGFLMTLEQNANRANLTGANESQLIDTSKIFMSADTLLQGHFRTVPMPRPDACGLTLGNGVPDVNQDVSTIHSGGANILFADGHVKWVTPEGYVQKLCEAAPYLQPPFRADGPHLP